jgi:hypothetical protein
MVKDPDPRFGIREAGSVLQNFTGYLLTEAFNDKKKKNEEKTMRY